MLWFIESRSHMLEFYNHSDDKTVEKTAQNTVAMLKFNATFQHHY